MASAQQMISRSISVILSHLTKAPVPPFLRVTTPKQTHTGTCNCMAHSVCPLKVQPFSGTGKVNVTCALCSDSSLVADLPFDFACSSFDFASPSFGFGGPLPPFGPFLNARLPVGEFPGLMLFWFDVLSSVLHSSGSASTGWPRQPANKSFSE